MRRATDPTSTSLSELLPSVLKKLEKCVEEKGDLILNAWPSIIGERQSCMTEAVAFKEGVLYVNVKNATSYSLLAQYEKIKLLKILREKFPSVEIRNIVFRMG